jgi:hypothetical protein
MLVRETAPNPCSGNVPGHAWKPLLTCRKRKILTIISPVDSARSQRSSSSQTFPSFESYNLVFIARDIIVNVALLGLTLGKVVS